ncbi:hypothetical protein D3C85_1895660 [compost metagenome]
MVDRVSRILHEERDIVFGSRPLAGVIRGSYFVIKGEYGCAPRAGEADDRSSRVNLPVNDCLLTQKLR